MPLVRVLHNQGLLLDYVKSWQQVPQEQQYTSGLHLGPYACNKISQDKQALNWMTGRNAEYFTSLTNTLFEWLHLFQCTYIHLMCTSTT